MRLITGTKRVNSIVSPQDQGPTHTGPHSFQTAYFVTQICIEGALNHSGEWFQKHADSVSGFTGFMWTKGRFI